MPENGALFEFFYSIKDISEDKFHEFKGLPSSERWLWILGAVVIPRQQATEIRLSEGSNHIHF